MQTLPVLFLIPQRRRLITPGVWVAAGSGFEGRQPPRYASTTAGLHLISRRRLPGRPGPFPAHMPCVNDPGPCGLLLDQHDGYALFPVDRPDEGKISWVMMGERPMEGSSRRSSSGFAISALPRASICCSPPERVPACWCSPLCIRGKVSRTIDHRARLSARPLTAWAAQLEVFFHGEVGEDPPSLGHHTDALFDDPVGPFPRDVPLLEDDRAGDAASGCPPRS